VASKASSGAIMLAGNHTSTGRQLQQKGGDRVFGRDSMILLGERHFRRAVTEFVAHYHRERNHQGLENALIEGPPTARGGRVHRQQRLGGLLGAQRDQPLIVFG
jgi:hypothetical protein